MAVAQDVVAEIIAHTESHGSEAPVRTVRYMVEIVLNEDNPSENDDWHKQSLAEQFQLALDAGFFTGLRYDRLEFDVVSRDVLAIAPAFP